MTSNIPSIFNMAKARNEAQAAMRRVLNSVSACEAVDPEDLVIIRGSSELFAEFAELYIEQHTKDHPVRNQ